MAELELEKKFVDLDIETVEGQKVFVATDETLDREGEILSIDAWDLANYKRNPLLLWGHDYREPAIGKASNIRFRTIGNKKKLTFEPEFHRKSPLSQLVADLVTGDWIKTVSVGFKPKERDGNRYTGQELLEISFVNIPANPEATSLALTKGYDQETMSKVFSELAVDKKNMEIDRLIEKINSLEEQIKSFDENLKRLEVAAKAANPAESPAVKPVLGRSAARSIISEKRVLQAMNRALSELLRARKEK